MNAETDAIELRLSDAFRHVLFLGSRDVDSSKWYGEELARIAMRELDHERTGWRLYNELVDRHNDERMHLQAVVAELKSLLRRACEADACEDCQFDHHGDCQAHGPWGDGKPCPYPFIRQYVLPPEPSCTPKTIPVAHGHDCSCRTIPPGQVQS